MMRPLFVECVETCPAKINLRLSVLNRRSDGYHNLRSIVAPVGLADGLTVQWAEDLEADQFDCSLEGLTEDPTANLVMRALQVFREEWPFPGGLIVRLEKRIPVGAGLGGGSSDAAGMLRILQKMWGNPLSEQRLHGIAARLGADVPLFLKPEFYLMTGIGDILEPIDRVREWMSEYRIALFKPWWGVNTAWAYRALIERGAYSAQETQDAVDQLVEKRDLAAFLKNDFRQLVDARYPSNALFYERLNMSGSIFAEMSGSGSAGFALFKSDEDWKSVQEEVAACWGDEAFCFETSFL